MKSEFYSRYYERRAERAVPFAVRSLGFNHCAPGCRFSEMQKRHPRNHWFDRKSGRVLDTLTICYVTRGHGFLTTAQNGEVEVYSNSISFLFPKVRHLLRYDEGVGWDSCWVEIDATAALPILRGAGIAPKDALRRFVALPTLSARFHRLIELSRKPQAGTGALLAAEAYGILAEVVSVWPHGTRNGIGAAGGDPIETAKRYLAGEGGDLSGVAQVARAVGLSESRFRDLFRRRLGVSPKQYQLGCRIARCSRLLATTKMTVTAIAEANGFESIYAFSRQFRRSTGLSPQDYRKRHGRKC